MNDSHGLSRLLLATGHGHKMRRSQVPRHKDISEAVLADEVRLLPYMSARAEHCVVESSVSVVILPYR